MKFDRKKIIMLLSSLLALQIVIILFLSFFSVRSVKDRKVEKKLIKGLEAKSIAVIEIKDKNDTFSIENKDDGWFVKVQDSYIPGDVPKIEKYLEILEKLPEGIIRDKDGSAENETYYGFDEENYQQVVFTTEKGKEYTIVIGNTGSKRGTSYVRYGDEKKIREVQSFIASETSNESVKWAKNNVFSDDIGIDDIQSCDIESSLSWYAGSYKINYKEQGNEAIENYELIPPADKPLKDFVLQNSLTNLIHLKADNYKLTGGVTPDNKKASISLLLKDGTSLKMFVYKADGDDEGDYVVDVDFNDYLYIVNEGDVKRIVKSIDEMIVPEEEKTE